MILLLYFIIVNVNEKCWLVFHRLGTKLMMDRRPDGAQHGASLGYLLSEVVHSMRFWDLMEDDDTA